MINFQINGSFFVAENEVKSEKRTIKTKEWKCVCNHVFFVERHSKLHYGCVIVDTVQE